MLVFGKIQQNLFHSVNKEILSNLIRMVFVYLCVFIKIYSCELYIKIHTISFLLLYLNKKLENITTHNIIIAQN